MASKQVSTQPALQLQPTRDALVDALRGFAILCMFVAHALPLLNILPTVPAALFDVLNDVASPLFALAMGMAGVIVLQRPHGTATGFVTGKVTQGALLISIGVALASLPTWVGVVLPQLGLLLIFGAPLLLIPARWFGWAAGVALAAGPLVSLLAGLLLPGEWIASPKEGPALLQWLVTGVQYRFTSLLPFFLLGAFFYSTQAIRKARACKMLAVGGGMLTLLAYPVAMLAKNLSAPHMVTSGGYVDLARDLGLVFLAVGLMGTTAMLQVGPMGAIATWFMTALAGPGKLALSLYAVHILLLVPIIAIMAALSQGILFAVFVAYVLGLLLLGWLWSRYLGRGPLELAMTWVGKTVRTVVENRAGRKVARS